MRARRPKMLKTLNLSETHKRMLRDESAISDEVIRARGYWTATEESELRELGFADYQCRVPALVIPVYGEYGQPCFHRIRPDNPRPDSKRPDKVVKYDQPAGMSLALDLPRDLGEYNENSTRLFVTEGERKADSITSCGEACVGLLGAWGWTHSKRPRPEWDTVRLIGRTMYIVFDSDAATKVEVALSEKRLAAYLEGRGADVCIVRLDPTDDDSKQGVDDYLASGGTIDELLEMARPAASVIKRCKGWPLLSEEMYHGLAGELVRAIKPNTEADPAALLVDFLATAGNIFGRGAHFKVEEDTHYCKLWPVLAGPSAAGRKGVAQGRINAAVEEVDPEWVRYNMVTGLASGEGVIHHTRDRVEKEEDGETVVVDEGVSDKRLYCEEPEFTTVLTQMQRNGNILSGILRQAWDDKMLSTLIKNKGEKSTDSHVTVVAHATPDDLRKNLTGDKIGGGIGNRFMFVLTKRSGRLPQGGKKDALGPKLIGQLRDAIRFGRERREIPLSEEVEEFWDHSAADIWDAVYDELTADRKGLYGQLVSRAAPYVRRIAVVYAALDRSEQVTIDHLLAALAVWEYSDASTRWLFGGKTGDETADEILAVLQMVPEGYTTTDFFTYFNRHITAGQLRVILEGLIEDGRVKSVKEKGEGPGRRPTRYFAVEDDDE
jgi:hypothetical protein